MRRLGREGGRLSPSASLKTIVALSLVIGAGAWLSACSSSGATSAATASTTDSSGTVWLCRPGVANNPCTTDLTTTVVGANGTASVQHAEPASNPPIDCFYVYPTVSPQTTGNADLHIDPAERDVAIQQAARFSQVCRVYAPMYRQQTLAAISRGTVHGSVSVAFQSLLAAWHDYLARYNDGRGIVFIGHSQGAAMLIALLSQEVDRNAALRHRLVSAILLGGNVTVPAEMSAGGDFENIPACGSSDQTGCVIAYSTFLTPPPADSLFGRVRTGLTPARAGAPLQVLCVNPSALQGGTGELEPYFSLNSIPGALGAAASQTLQPANGSGGASSSGRSKISTPWVAFPDLYSAQCQQSGGASWLGVSRSSAGDPRPQLHESLGPAWGLHLVDVNIALGNLVSDVRSEEHSYSHG